MRVIGSVMRIIEETMDHESRACNIHSFSSTSRPPRTREKEDPYGNFSHHTAPFDPRISIGSSAMIASKG